MNPDCLRERLNAWALTDERPCVSTLPPKCACERASPPPGGHGPVEDAEHLAYFVTSRYNKDIKRKRKFSPNKLKNVFDKGLSSVRMNVCSKEEIFIACGALVGPLRERDGDFGGIVEVAVVRCDKVRLIKFDDAVEDRVFCVYETPAGLRDDGKFDQPSHADIVSSCKIGDPELQQLILPQLFNALTETGEVISIFDFYRGIFSEFAPQALNSA